MPVRIDVYDFKCFNQLRNGVNFDQNLSEFTPNLVGNVGERLKISFSANFGYQAVSSASDNWILGDDFIERSSGNFIDDGFNIGDEFDYFTQFVLENFEFSAVVDTISSDGKRITFTVTVSSVKSQGEGIDQAGIIVDTFGDNPHTAAFLKFGLIENSEQFNFVSKVSGNEQIYYAGDLIKTTASNLSDMISLGRLKDWQTGTAKAVFLNASPESRRSQYNFEHEFILNPYYIVGYLTFLQNDTIPALFDGSFSLKYAFEIEFRKTLTDILSSKTYSEEKILGVTGWFNENFNGFNNLYEIKSISYNDSFTNDQLDGISINSSTTITYRIAKKDDIVDNNISISFGISYLPTSRDEYTDVETSFEDNFLYDNIVLSNPATSNTGTNIIKQINYAIIDNEAVVQVVIEYDVLQRLKLDKSSQYILFTQIEDATKSAGNSDRVQLLLDLNNYTDLNFVEGFVSFNDYTYFIHSQDPQTDPGSFSLNQVINEDGLVLRSSFGIDTSKEVFINAIQLKLIAFNKDQNSFFELDSYDIDLSSQTITANVQEFNIEASRGYVLADDDPFNIVELKTGSRVVDEQFYDYTFPQKIRWQDWQRNDNVDPVFFDPDKPNENLNFKSSNYSDVNGYSIRIATIINVTGFDDLGRRVSGSQTFFGGELKIQDYNSSLDYSGLIETLDPDTLSPLGGGVLYNGKNTIFRTTYNKLLPVDPVFYAIHRIEVNEAIGDGISELSSVVDPPINNLLIPLEGETLLKVTETGSQVITECQIDGSRVEEGINYKLSARLRDSGVERVALITVNTLGDIDYTMFTDDGFFSDSTGTLITFPINTAETITLQGNTPNLIIMSSCTIVQIPSFPIFNLVDNWEWRLDDNPFFDTEEKLVAVISELLTVHDGTKTGQVIKTLRYVTTQENADIIANLDPLVTNDILYFEVIF